MSGRSPALEVQDPTSLNGRAARLGSAHDDITLYLQRTRYTGQSKTTAFLSVQLKPSVIRQRKPSRIDLSIEPADTEYQNVFRSVEHAVGSLTSQDLRNTRFTVNVTKRPAFTITKMY